MTSKAAATNDLDRIGPVVLVVAALHAALLMTTTVRSSRAVDGAATAVTLQVRTIHREPGAPTSPPATEVRAPTHEARPPAARQPAVVSPPQMPEMPHALPATPRVAPVESASPPLPALGLVMPGADSDDDYYPRTALSLAPSAVDPIVIAYPPIDDDAGYHKREVMLFIDERGQVARLRVEGDALPAALETAVREAFMSARFVAGEAQGRPVKSKIRIEVVFDQRPSNG